MQYPAAARTAIHVGISSGLAFVEATKLSAVGSGRWTCTASGPTTNLAARIAGLAEGGDIRLGAQTTERIKKYFVLEDTGQPQLKNVSELVQVFRLVINDAVNPHRVVLKEFVAHEIFFAVRPVFMVTARDVSKLSGPARCH